MVKSKTPQKLTVKVTPNASQNKIVGFHENQLKVKIQAPPQKGKANQELIKFLAQELDTKKQFIKIIQGESSSIKVLEIRNLSQKDLSDKLKKASK